MTLLIKSESRRKYIFCNWGRIRVGDCQFEKFEDVNMQNVVIFILFAYFDHQISNVILGLKLDVDPKQVFPKNMIQKFENPHIGNGRQF